MLPLKRALSIGAKGFGLPTTTQENVVLFPSATGRNLGAGFLSGP
jgi:hypothetical protein